MAEVQLKLVKRSEDGVFGKAMHNLNRMLYSPSGSFFNLTINAKRNNVVKYFLQNNNLEKIENDKKRSQMMNKYEKNYEAYLTMLENYIKETIYNKSKKKISSIKENKILSHYYELMNLKNVDLVEYKYKRQTLLLAMDWDLVLATKGNAFVEKYKKFYISVVEQLYKALMRHYAINLTDASKDKSQTYQNIYALIDDYIQYILPYTKESETKDRILEVYKKEVATIDIYNKKAYNEIKRNLILLELSKFMFAYSLPMIALDQCYQELIVYTRTSIMNSYLDADKFETYQLLIDLIESYNINVLSKKIYWDTDNEKEAYTSFWNQYNEFKKLERIDYSEYMRLREVHFIMDDMKKIKEDKKYDELRSYYRDRMKLQRGLRRFQNKVGTKPGIWRTRRRQVADKEW